MTEIREVIQISALMEVDPRAVESHRYSKLTIEASVMIQRFYIQNMIVFQEARDWQKVATASNCSLQILPSHGVLDLHHVLVLSVCD